MAMDEENDPEACYRRGYAHGAQEVFGAISAVLPANLSVKLDGWLKDDVANWRLANLRDLDSTRHHAPRFNPKSN
jgi:hypothetical protein